MSMTFDLVASLAFGVAAVGLLLLRFNAMDEDTDAKVVYQHVALLAGVCLGLILPGYFGKAATYAGIVAFLGLSYYRWRFKAPSGTQRLTGEAACNPTSAST